MGVLDSFDMDDDDQWPDELCLQCVDVPPEISSAARPLRPSDVASAPDVPAATASPKGLASLLMNTSRIWTGFGANNVS